MNKAHRIYLKAVYIALAIAALVVAAGAPGEWPVP